MLSTRQIDLIQKGFAQADAPPDQIIGHLFDALFRIDPGLRYLFPAELQDLKRRFGFMLGYLVHRLDKWDELVPRLKNLGARHVSYGVQIRHYKTFGDALMETLRVHLALSSDSEDAIAWQSLYNEVSSVMIAAACELETMEIGS